MLSEPYEIILVDEAFEILSQISLLTCPPPAESEQTVH